MEIVKIPNPDRVGEYYLFVKNFSLKQKEALERRLFTEERLTKVYLSFSDPGAEVNPGFCTETEITSDENLGRLRSKIRIPNWVRNTGNLERILSGDYMDLQPITAEFVTTLNCNFRCIQCSYSEPKKIGDVWLKESGSQLSPVFQANHSITSHMPREVMEVTLDRLTEGGVVNILFTGGGEPLMNPLTLEGMARAKRNGHVIALYTNGRLMTDKVSEELFDLNPLFVRVSVYGGNQESTTQYTQALSDRSSFREVIKNIGIFATKKRESGSNTTFGLSYLVHPLTSGSIRDFALSILDLHDLSKIDYIRFTPAVDYFFGKQHDQASMEGVFSDIEKTIVPLFQSTGVKIKPYYHRLTDLNSKKTYSTCRASGWFVEVGPSGEMFLCCEKHFLPDYRIGDLTKQTLREIWESDLRRSVVRTINESHCDNCPTLCKPHELNKLFDAVEIMKDRGEISFIDQWTKDLILYAKYPGYCPGKLDDFQS